MRTGLPVLVLCALLCATTASADSLDSLFKEGYYNIQLKDEFRTCATDQDCTYMESLCPGFGWWAVSKGAKDKVKERIEGSGITLRCARAEGHSAAPQTIHCLHGICEIK